MSTKKKKKASIQELKKKLLEDPNVKNNIAAANELAKASEREEAIRLLRQGFEIPSPKLHTALMNALVSHKAKEAIPEISDCLKSFSPSVRDTAIQALVNPNIRDVKVVDIFKDRIRFERDNTAKALYIQRLADLPFEETVDYLVWIFKIDRYRASPLIEDIRNSLATIAHISPEKLIEELGKLDSPIDEIVTILKNIDLSKHPNVWDSLMQSLDVDSAARYEKIHYIIVEQITRSYDEDRVSKILSKIPSVEASGREKERCIRILDDISKTPHGPKLIKPTLQLVKELSEEKRKKGWF